MKKTILLFLSLLTLSISAQKALENPKYGATEEERKECLQNLSVYSEYVKQKNYADAVSSWETAIKICPKATKNLYIHGVKIKKHLIKVEKDVEKKKALVEELLALYDQRIEHFGKEGFVLGQKGADEYNMKKDDLSASYKSLKKSLELQKGKSKSSTILYYMLAASDLFKQNKITKEEVIAAYNLANSTTDLALKSAKKEKIIKSLKSKKAKIEKIFVATGAANCNDLKLAFEPQIAASKDPSLYRSILKTLEGAGCNFEDFYNELVEKTYKLEPSAEEAVALAKKFYADINYAKAEQYYQEALGLESDDSKKSDYLYRIAFMNLKDEKYDEAKKNAKEAIKLDKDNGSAYMLLGDMYAKKSKDYKDSFEKGTVFWVVVDMFKKAKSANPELIAEANKKIKTYSKYFPELSDIFFRNLKEGSSYKVGGWINETTRIRKRK